MRLKKLTKRLLKKAEENKVDWLNLVYSYKLNEEFIEKYADQLDWGMVSYWQKLSEDFIEIYIKKIHWDHICEAQELSEAFIYKYRRKVNWEAVCKHQKLSEEFIYKHIGYIIFRYLLRNDNIKNYSNKLQDLILEKLIDCIHKSDIMYMTPYMEKQYEKYRILL